MDGVLTSAEWLLSILALLVLVPVVLLAARRRWLARLGGSFECSVRLHDTTPGSGWVLGVARYQGDRVEWFRSFSASFRPRLEFVRGQAHAGPQRVPTAIESVVLFEDQRIVELTTPEGSWEVAMTADSLTGMLSWLEAAPPGTAYRARY